MLMTVLVSSIMPLLAARSSDNDLMKILFGVGAVLVWGLFQLMAAVAKRQEEAKRRARYGRLPSDVARSPGGYGGYGGAGPMPPKPPPVPTPWSQQQARAKSGNKGRGKGSKKRPTQAPAAAFARGQADVRAVPVRQAEAVAEPPQASRRAAAAAPAGQVARLLRRPESLRAAFILNEVLSKPVGLRGE